MPEPSQPHYFTTAAGDGTRRIVPVTLAGREAELVTADGVFSGGHVDLGTRVLLREAPDPPPGDCALLDLGCGWGPIALAMALRAPGATVWAVDVNVRALALTSENAQRLGLTGVRAVHPGEVPDDVRFAAIWSNPPIRIGKPALHDLLLRWLGRLVPGGAAHLVVQRHLGADSLHSWLAAQAPDPGGAPFTVTRAGSAKGYRVLRVGR